VWAKIGLQMGSDRRKGSLGLSERFREGGMCGKYPPSVSGRLWGRERAFWGCDGWG